MASEVRSLGRLRFTDERMGNRKAKSVKRTDTIASSVRKRKATWFWPEIPDDGEFRLDMLRD